LNGKGHSLCERLSAYGSFGRVGRKNTRKLTYVPLHLPVPKTQGEGTFPKTLLSAQPKPSRAAKNATDCFKEIFRKGYPIIPNTLIVFIIEPICRKVNREIVNKLGILSILYPILCRNNPFDALQFQSGTALRQAVLRQTGQGSIIVFGKISICS